MLRFGLEMARLILLTLLFALNTIFLFRGVFLALEAMDLLLALITLLVTLVYVWFGVRIIRVYYMEV